MSMRLGLLVSVVGFQAQFALCLALLIIETEAGLENDKWLSHSPSRESFPGRLNVNLRRTSLEGLRPLFAARATGTNPTGTISRPSIEIIATDINHL